MAEQYQGASSVSDGGTMRGTAEAGFRRLKEDVVEGGDKAKERLADFADTQKGQISGSLGEFAKAIEKASEELRGSDQTLAAQVVREAADGLGRLSRSIGGATTSDLVSSVRDFGRSNPLAFVGGAMLAGLALGRFARAEPPRRSSGSGQSSGYPQQNYGTDRSSGFGSSAGGGSFRDSSHRGASSAHHERSTGEGFGDDAAFGGDTEQSGGGATIERTIP